MGLSRAAVCAGALSSGGCVCLVTEQMRRDAVGLLRYVRDARIERVFLPFVALQGMCDALDVLGGESAARHALRMFLALGSWVGKPGPP